MPYIPEKRREELGERLTPAQHGRNRIQSAGELTYLFTQLVEQYRAEQGDSFGTFANIVGALEQTKDEFQRRVVHPYEDNKILTNGDVYTWPEEEVLPS
jgi:hypothetical protein